MKEELKQSLPEQLQKWNTKTETEIFEKKEEELYINRSLKASLIKGDQSEQFEVSDLLQLLEQSPRNARIIVTGEAGSGKTTLLRHITNSWLQTEALYDLVFYIPLGRSRSHDIEDIICRDLDLLPKKWRDSLSEVLEGRAKRILFLLDSYEELRNETKELENLITGDLYPHSTVVVTTRPGSHLSDITQRMHTRIETQLQDFSEEEMERYIQVYLSQEQGGELSEIVEHFFGHDFLQRPFNLALACYLHDVHRAQDDTASSINMLSTQTVLLSEIVQHTVQAYVRKKRGMDVPVTNGSPLENEHFPPEAKTMLKEISRMCFHAFREKQQWLSVKDNTVVTMQDLLDFGLFTSSPEPDSVSVPHSLFLEYLAAVYLVADKPAWEALYAEIQKKLPGLCLKDAVKPLENVIKFVVGLSPVMTTQLCKLLVISQHQVTFNIYNVCDMSYEITLLNECNDDSTKSAIATALLHAPVCDGPRTSSDPNNKGSDQLLQYFSEEECLSFLKKTYGCHLVNRDKSPTLFWIKKGTRYVWDDFAVRCVEKYNYSVQMKWLRIIDCTLPVGLLSHNMAGVETLVLNYCMLHGTVADNTHRDETVGITSDGASHTQTGQCTLGLVNMKGLQFLSDVTLPGIGTLYVDCHQDIDLDVLSHTCTEVSHLNFLNIKSVTISTAIGCRMWDKLKQVLVADSGVVDLGVLARVCGQLGDLVITDCKRVLVDTDESVTRWPSVSRLVLQSSPVEKTTGEHLTESTARQKLSEMCPSAEIYIYGYNEQVWMVMSISVSEQFYLYCSSGQQK